MTYATVMVSLALDQPRTRPVWKQPARSPNDSAAGIIGIAASQFGPPLYFTSGQLAQDLIEEGRAAIREANRRTGIASFERR